MEGMTRELLLQYLSGFPEQLAVAVFFLILPLRKKRGWILYLPVTALLVTGVVFLNMALWPLLVRTGDGSAPFFGLHYLMVLAAYAVGVHLMTAASWREAAYCVICAYMTQHLNHCLGLVADHFVTGISWWFSEPMSWVKLTLVCGLVWLLFARRICREGHYPDSALKALTLLVLVMAVMFFLSIRVSELQEGWLHGVYTALLILVLMYEELRSADQLRLQGEIQTREDMDALHRTQYEMSKENIALLNRKSHDLRRQVAALRTVGTPEEQAEAIREIEQTVQTYDSTFRTGSRALDTVLTQKALACAQQGIELTVMADGSLLRFMKSVDLFTMVSNILDNAMEANARIPAEEKRSIHLSVHEKRGLVILQCENPYSGTIEMRDGLPVTTKADKASHGFGTRSVSATAAEYGGVTRITTDGGMFVIRLIFQPPDVNQDEKTTT